MPFLTINGNEIPIQTNGAVRHQDAAGGKVRRSFNGNLLVSLKNPKREWSFSTRPLTILEASAIKGVIGPETYQEKTIDGTGIEGPRLCIVLIGEQPYIQDGIIHQLILELSILEI